MTPATSKSGHALPVPNTPRAAGMPAMTMGLEIADKKMLEGFKVGDKVRFQAEMVKGKATVTELHKAK